MPSASDSDADIDDSEAVGERQQLVEVLGDHERRRPRAGEVEQRLVDRGRRPGVDAPGRLGDHQHARVLQDLAADDELLQVAAGQAARQRVGAAARLTPNSSMISLGEVARPAGAG